MTRVIHSAASGIRGRVGRPGSRLGSGNFFLCVHYRDPNAVGVYRGRAANLTRAGGKKRNTVVVLYRGGSAHPHVGTLVSGYTRARILSAGTPARGTLRIFARAKVKILIRAGLPSTAVVFPRWKGINTDSLNKYGAARLRKFPRKLKRT